MPYLTSSNDREWHKEYESGRKQQSEHLPEFDYPPNLEVNEQLNCCWKRYIQKPILLKALSKLEMPSLFVYGTQDIRPMWPVEQVARLMPNARFELIEGAEHILWLSHPNQLRLLLRSFVGDIKRREGARSGNPKGTRD
jgi:proline iminopeptidase